jgi:NAD(P)H-dependent FMN reductase
MHITIVLGSVRKDRQSFRLGYYLEKRLSEKGVVTDVLDLAETPLPVFGQEGEASVNADQIGRRLRRSDALLLVTPEYHGSFSGALKNALDYYWEEYYRKPIAVAAASAGKMGGINASVQLQHVILSLGAYPLPVKLLVPQVQDAFDDSFAPVRESVTQAADHFLDEFLWFADALCAKKAPAAAAQSAS